MRLVDARCDLYWARYGLVAHVTMPPRFRPARHELDWTREERAPSRATSDVLVTEASARNRV